MGSHRSDGNTAYYVNEIGKKLNEKAISYRILDINRLDVNHCIDCVYCKNNWGLCIHNDDMTDIYEQLKCARVAIFASPVYFNGLTSKLKTLVDRCQMIFLCDFSHKIPFVDDQNKHAKLGYAISVGGANYYEDQFRGNEGSLKLVFDNLRMTFKRHLTYSGTDHTGIRENSAVLKDIQVLVDEIESEVTNHDR
jgi:multimeric flavodoxin WrbA